METSSVQEEISFIKNVIKDTQKIFVQNGYQYILWSGLAIIGILLKYANEQFELGVGGEWIWIPIIIIGWILSIILKKKNYLEIRSKTFSQKIFDATWTALAISFPILALIGFYTKLIENNAVPSVIATLFACGYYITSYLSDLKWMRFASYIWWIFAVTMFLFPGRHSVALLALMLIAFQFIPGIVMSRKWKKEFREKNK